MYRLNDISKEAKKYWLHQGIANNRISGRDISPEDIVMLERWIDEDVPEAEQTRRLVVMAIGGDTMAERVKNLARYYQVKPSADYSEWLSDALNKLEGIDGDDTLSLIADLMREGVLTVDDANTWTLMHVRERSR
ncbi:hypothetical protein U8C31_18345 [Sinorhizobium medicae]|uniref:hypothetical protein n=1 Tax=Sinorhizobium medicae TaxID=110321 RepID=UPI002AF6C21D|nr:hypothetical protein [Sinorhizobium medicae]WQO72197.1 hypothetical protein U8C31_18345 [Sinorhizobium medicae]